MAKQRRKLTELDPHSDQIQKLAAEGLSCARIAKALDIDADGHMVDRWIKKHGIERAKVKFASVLDPFAEDIRRMYSVDGLTDRMIADALPVSVTENSVYNYRLQKLNIPTSRKRKSGRFTKEALYDDVKDQLPEAWERSKRWHATQKRMVGSAQRVGAQFGVSTATAQKWLARHGLVERRIDGKKAGSKAFELFQKGWGVPRIAKELGATQASVRNWLNERGCDLSNPTKRMSHEEWIAWRTAISRGKATAIAGSGRYSYEGFRLDSAQEVVFVKNCDRLSLRWETYDRASMGVCEVSFEEQVVRYAPDLVVEGIAVEVKGIYDSTAARKVQVWRESMGPLALIMREELFAFEAAKSAREAMHILEGACYLDPAVEDAFWEKTSDSDGARNSAPTS
jgi:predicted transcriptional regulator